MSSSTFPGKPLDGPVELTPMKEPTALPCGHVFEKETCLSLTRCGLCKAEFSPHSLRRLYLSSEEHHEVIVQARLDEGNALLKEQASEIVRLKEQIATLVKTFGKPSSASRGEGKEEAREDQPTALYSKYAAAEKIAKNRASVDNC